MITLPPQIRVFLYRLPTDGLVALTESAIQQDPLSGSLFVFVNRRRDRNKILYWGQTGYCLVPATATGNLPVARRGCAGRTADPGSHAFAVVADAGRDRPGFRSPADAFSVAPGSSSWRRTAPPLTRCRFAVRRSLRVRPRCFFEVAFFLKKGPKWTCAIACASHNAVHRLLLTAPSTTHAR